MSQQNLLYNYHILIKIFFKGRKSYKIKRYCFMLLLILCYKQNLDEQTHEGFLWNIYSGVKSLIYRMYIFSNLMDISP
jgi:hypothetical protein